ncbi:DUF4238 domain-containing protein [Pusillimonas sp. DMV24BSW_D]|uniref:DUF4238 domain-containing protein n=1 Tax=Neopusillimonas aestuarii TaxID=2716226 RepID=UPI00140BFE75|nr:DUF4238 domain-containing protein [Pusillimonas sp. DMV24BSW_D]QIM50232.1 DUF4238 domain-containing protein [Pusillimonas sp. DMV24BSW_D]
MATNKNQHFVPRCHLRPFTLGAAGLAISLINLDRKVLIPNAPVKSQCSKDYFYGSDEKLESAIQLIESGYGRALKDLVSNSRFLSEANKTVFSKFWLFQHLRTEAAAIRAVQLMESTRKLVDLSPTEFSLSIKEAVQIACRGFVGTMHELDDLKFCVIKNSTGVPFITSDNPAVLTNKWRLDQDKSPGLSFGVGSAGVLVILPLTPKLLLLGYDGDVYSVPNERGVIKLKNPRDAIALNRHQFLQCTANVYVHDTAHANDLFKHYSDIEATRPKERHVIHYAQLDSNDLSHTRYVVIPPEARDETKEAILHSQVIHPHPGIWPSQISIRANGSVYTNGTGIGYVRLSRARLSSSRDFWRERP